MDEAHFHALEQIKRENYALIYENTATRPQLESVVRPMMAEMYDRLLSDLIEGKTTSPIFTHHINYVNRAYHRDIPYGQGEDPNQIVVDYIASMTDDYFIDLHRFLFPNSEHHVEYRGYFD
jgi:dGTPase